MLLVKCTTLPGKPKHSMATCEARIAKAEESAEAVKKANRNRDAKKTTGEDDSGTGRVVGSDYFIDLCLGCDPTKMKTVEVDESKILPPSESMTARPFVDKKEVKAAADQRGEILTREREMEMKEDMYIYVCNKCGTATKDRHKFMPNLGICRACYMRDFYKKNPPKTGSKLAPKKSKGDVVDELLKDAEVVSGASTVLDFELSPAEQNTTVPVCVDCGIKCTEADVFNMEEKLCGACELKEMTWEEKKAAMIKAGGIEYAKGTVLMPGNVTIQFPTVAVEFKNRKDLYEFLKEIASDEFREPAGQILALVEKEMKLRRAKEA